MSRWNAILRAMLCGAATGVLLYIAFGEDVVGTVQNLIADVLSAAVATVALRQLFVMGARRRLAAEFATPYQDALKLLEIQERHYKSVAAWAAKGLEAISETMMRYGRYGLSYPLSADLLQARLRSLEANYGTLTFRHVASRLCAAKEIVDARMATADSIFDRADNWKRINSLAFLNPTAEAKSIAPEVERLKEVLTELTHSTGSVLHELELLRDLLDFHAPKKLAERRRPDPLAPWLTRAIVGLGVLCATVTIVSLSAPKLFWQDFGAGTLNNIVSAAAAGFVGALLLVIERYRSSHAELVYAGIPGSNILNAITHIGPALGKESLQERADIFRSVATVIRDCIYQLHYVVPDPRLDRYADDLVRELEAALARPGSDDYRVVPPDVMASLGLTSMRAPSQNTSQLLEAASRLSDCVYGLIFEGRSAPRSSRRLKAKAK